MFGIRDAKNNLCLFSPSFTKKDYPIRDRLLRSQQSARLLELYRQVLRQKEVIAAGSSEEGELLLSGLVVKQQGHLRINNRIYESIFDRNWVKQHIQGFEQ